MPLVDGAVVWNQQAMTDHSARPHDQGQPEGGARATLDLSEFTEGELRAFVAGYVCACTDNCEVESVLEEMGRSDLAERIHTALEPSCTGRLVASLWPEG